MRVRPLLISTACLWGLLGCGTDPDSSCEGPYTVTVTREEQPMISWTPADCRMYEVDVDETQLHRWRLGGYREANYIPSPVRYGTTEPNSGSLGGAPLFTGFFYNVDLWRLDEEGLPRRVASHRFLHRER